MRNILAILIFVLIGSSALLSQNQVPVASEKFKVKSQRKLKKQVEDLDIFKNSFTGICVYDYAKEKYVFELNADKYFTPASNLKILTYLAAKKAIPNRVPVLYYTEKEDSLIIWGSASPSTMAIDFKDSTLLRFIEHQKKKIYFSDGNFLDTPFAPGWAWEDYRYSFSKESSSLPVFSNSLNVNLSKSNGLKIEPAIYKDSVEIFYTWNYRSSLIRDRHKNRFRLVVGYDRDSTFLEAPLLIRSTDVAKILSLLSTKEIEAVNRPMFQNDIVSTLYGTETDSLLKKMMHESDNFIAESMILMSAGNFGQEDSLSRALQIKKLTEKYFGFLNSEIKWIDGSGLSRYNLLSPRSLVDVLIEIRKDALKSEGSMQKVFDLFANGGSQGTIKSRFKGMRDAIYAKSGSLSNNNNLSGYLVTKSGKLLIFSFMNNHFLESNKLIQEQSDNIIKAFYLYY